VGSTALAERINLAEPHRAPLQELMEKFLNVSSAYGTGLPLRFLPEWLSDFGQLPEEAGAVVQDMHGANSSMSCDAVKLN
jgi:hypothetical protein